MGEEYSFEYLNENEFKKKERAIKKYNMLAYKKLLFDYYPSLREGIFQGILVANNKKKNITVYELKLPTDSMFSKVHGDIVLHYSVYGDQKVVVLETLAPEDILTEGHQNELTTYKGVMVSKSHKDLDMFKINLLNGMNGGNSYNFNAYDSGKKVGDGKMITKEKERKTDNDIKTTKKTKVNEEKIKIDKLALKQEFTIDKLKNDRYKNILNDMDKVLDNSFDNMDYYYDKFNKWIIVYLNEKEKRFLEIKEDFFEYLLKTTNDIGLINSIKLLRYNVLFDINLFKWLKSLVKQSVIKERKYNYASEQLIYSLNLSGLSKIQQEILCKKQRVKMPKYIFLIVIILIGLIGCMCYFTMIGNKTTAVYEKSLEDYIISDNIGEYPDLLHSEENIKYLVSKLSNADDFDSVVTYLYVYGETVFNYNNDDAYYIRISDSYYEWLVEQIEYYGDSFNNDIIYEEDNSWCDGKNVTSGMLRNDGYKFRYMYEIVNDGYVLNYYIYHYDILISYGEDKTVNCYSDKTVGDVFKEYFEDNNYYVYLFYQHMIIDRDEKSITFKDVSEDKEFKLQVYDRYIDNNERCVVLDMGEEYA